MCVTCIKWTVVYVCYVYKVNDRVYVCNVYKANDRVYVCYMYKVNGRVYMCARCIKWTGTIYNGDRRVRDRMLVGFTTTYAINTYHNSYPGRGVFDTTLCDKVCQWFVTGRWFSRGIPVSSINKSDRSNIAEILLKVMLNTKNPT
jgi:hypothetical protein